MSAVREGTRRLTLEILFSRYGGRIVCPVFPAFRLVRTPAKTGETRHTGCSDVFVRLRQSVMTLFKQWTSRDGFSGRGGLGQMEYTSFLD